MGFIDAFKRWRLAQRGMSSGKKRRTAKSGSGVVDSMEQSIWIKLLIYPVFAVLACLVVAFHVSEGLLFFDEAIQRTLICLILVAGVILFYHLRGIVWLYACTRRGDLFFPHYQSHFG